MDIVSPIDDIGQIDDCSITLAQHSAHLRHRLADIEVKQGRCLHVAFADDETLSRSCDVDVWIIEKDREGKLGPELVFMSIENMLREIERDDAVALSLA